MDITFFLDPVGQANLYFLNLKTVPEGRMLDWYTVPGSSFWK